MTTKTCECGNAVEMGHTAGRHKAEDFGIVHGSCDDCGRVWDDINGEWITPDVSDGEWVSVDTSVSSVIVTTEDATYRLEPDGRPKLWKIP